jgi:hypothetical protein
MTTSSFTRESALQSTLLGALVGATVGYLCFTEEGRVVLERVDAWLDATIERMQRLQDAATKGRSAVEEARRTLHTVEHALEDVAHQTP